MTRRHWWSRYRERGNIINRIKENTVKRFGHCKGNGNFVIVKVKEMASFVGLKFI